MQILASRLAKLMEEKRVEKISELKTKVEIEWGSQIRSYVLHPYKMVKDHRSGVKSSKPEEVLDGKLDKFIQ
jgi:peptide chain release factor 2